MKQSSLLKQIEYENKICVSCKEKFVFKRFYRERCNDCMIKLEMLLKNHYGNIERQSAT